MSFVYFCMKIFSADGLPAAWNYMGGENIISKVINKLFTHDDNWKFAGKKYSMKCTSWKQYRSIQMIKNLLWTGRPPTVEHWLVFYMCSHFRLDKTEQQEVAKGINEPGFVRTVKYCFPGLSRTCKYQIPGFSRTHKTRFQRLSRINSVQIMAA